MNIIAVDCGASFIKFALFKDDTLVKSKHISAPQVINDESVFCTDRIEALIHSVKDGLNMLSAEVEDSILSIDNEMHGFILAYPDGRPYTDYISWQTELIGSSEVETYIRDSVGEEKSQEFIRHTGMPLRSGLPSSTLYWLYRNGYLERQTPLFFYTLGDYIIKRITEKEPLCHLTNAAATGLVDLETGDWNREYISLLIGNADIVFPKIGKAETEYSDGGKRFSVLPAIGDQQAALLRSSFDNIGQLSVNMGTGAQVSRLLADGFQYGDYQIRPYFFGSYIRTIPHIPSGRAINVFFRFLKGILSKLDREIEDETVWNIMQESVSSEAKSSDDLCCDLSFFENAVTGHSKGSISNITEYGFTLESLLNSVFRQITDNIVTIAERVNEGLPEYKAIIFSGGIAKRWDILREEIADKMRAEAKVVLSENDALFGCMRYAMMDTEQR